MTDNNLLINMLKRRSLRKSILFPFFACLWLGFLCACQADRVDQYLHQDFTLVWSLPREDLRGPDFQPITPQEASWFAVQHLIDRGVKDIVVCEARWIAAPLGGYLIDSLGSLNQEDKTYTLFRVGVRDGTDNFEGYSEAGQEFVFIALGKNRAGEIKWYPSPGPDYDHPKIEPFPIELLAYEFLVDREEFENLADRYP